MTALNTLIEQIRSLLVRRKTNEVLEATTAALEAVADRLSALEETVKNSSATEQFSEPETFQHHYEHLEDGSAILHSDDSNIDPAVIPPADIFSKISVEQPLENNIEITEEVVVEESEEPKRKRAPRTPKTEG